LTTIFKGTLSCSNKKVANPPQVIAIGIIEARKAGGALPPAPKK
jgi:hypothetical protein